MVFFISINLQLHPVPLWLSIERSAIVLIVELLALRELVESKLTQ